MAIPVLETSATNSALATTTLTINKPTGLAEGDLLLVKLASADIAANSATWNTPSGWTLVQSGGTGTGFSYPAAFYKIATSTDVAASNFSFTVAANATALSGCLMRITGFDPAAPIGASEIDQQTGSVTTMTHTTALTPVVNNNLLVFSFAGAGNAFTLGTPTIASYASTPAATWVEVADVGATNASSDGHGFGVAQADYVGTTQITSRQAVISQTSNNGYSSIALAVRGTEDANATLTLTTTGATGFAPNVVVGVNRTLGATEVGQQTQFTPQAQATAPTQWTNESEESTTWTNESL